MHRVRPVQGLVFLVLVFVPASVAAVVVVVVVASVLALDLLGLTWALQVELAQVHLLGALRGQRGRRAPDGAEVNDWLRKEQSG